MDAGTLITTALAAGAVSGTKDVASAIVKDSYNEFKAGIRHLFVGKPEAEMALAQYEQKPDIWEAPLRAALVETGADRDEAILTAAQQLLALIQPAESQSGKYNVRVGGDVHGLVQGDQAQVKMTFGERSDH